MRLFNILIAIIIINFAGFVFADDFTPEGETEIQVSADNFILDANDTGGDIQLQFGGNIAKYLKWDNTNIQFSLNDTLEIAGNLSITGEILDSDGNTGIDGQILTSDGTGKNLWQTIMASTIPYISTSIVQSMGTTATKTLSFEGANFLPNSIVSIPNFDGTINSTTIISPTNLEINVTAGSNPANYDIIVSNDGVLNTEWTDNGKNLFVVSNNNGASQSTAGESCKSIIDTYTTSTDGTYWINPDGGDTSNAFQVYCDMTTDGGGWTRIEYAADLPHQAQFSDGDTSRYLDNNFTFVLTDTQINNIRSVSTEGKQRYHGTCQGVIHYLYQTDNYQYAFGFKFHQGDETAHLQQTYPNTNITVLNDGCKINNNTMSSTDFDIVDIRVPILNVYSRDNSSTEQFGSPLTSYPAWLR